MENITTNKEESLKHTYFELDSDLMAKPNALCDLILINKISPVVVFANTPSEADLVDSVLTRNNINSSKLIGHVPYAKVVDTVKRAKDGEIQAVVVTDVAARELDAGSFKALINYSVPLDPETYLNRFAGLTENSQLESIVSFVYPTDFSNFHYLKKIVDFDIEQAQLPDKTDFYKELASEFLAKAKEFTTSDKKIEIFIEYLKENNETENVLSFLLNSYLNQKVEKKHKKFEKPAYQQYQQQTHEEPRHEKRVEKQQIKFSRLYIGLGSNHNITTEELKSKIAETSSAEIVKISMRPNYTFIDVLNSEADDLIQKVENTELAGNKIFISKATVVTTLKVEEQQESENTDSSEIKEEETTQEASNE